MGRGTCAECHTPRDVGTRNAGPVPKGHDILGRTRGSDGDRHRVVLIGAILGGNTVALRTGKIPAAAGSRTGSGQGGNREGRRQVR